MPESKQPSGIFLLEQAMKLKYLEGIKGLIIDMDGVLWRDNEPIGDLPAIFARIRSLGLRVVLATNNATRTVDDYHQKVAGFGVELEDGEIITSAEATAIYLQERYPNGCRVYAVGQHGLKSTLKGYGHTVVDDQADQVQVVVAAMDTGFNYQTLRHAANLIRSGCLFLGTNPDPTYPTPDGLAPGSGTMVGALELASGRKAKIIGKPEPLLYEMALHRLNMKPEETMGVGDRLETDIAGAQAAGMRSALVLTGVSSRKEGLNFSPPPDVIVENLAELVS